MKKAKKLTVKTKKRTPAKVAGSLKKAKKKFKLFAKKEQQQAIQEIFDQDAEVTGVTVLHKPDFTSFDLATVLKEHSENKHQLSRVKMKLHNKRGAFAAYKRNTTALINALQRRYESDVRSDDTYISNLENQLDFAVMLVNRARSKTGQEPIDRQYLLKYHINHV